MKEFLSFLKNKKDLGNLILVGILVLSIPLTVGLVQRQQVLTSRAVDETIKFTGPNVIIKDGKKVATKTKIAIQLSSPFGPPDYKLGNTKVRSYSPSIDLVRKAYGEEDNGGDEGDEGDGDEGGDTGDDDGDGSSDSEAETSTSEDDGHVSEGYQEWGDDGILYEFLGGDAAVEENWKAVEASQQEEVTCTDNCADSIPVVAIGEELQAISGLKTLSGYSVIVKTITDINGNERIVFLPVGNQYGAYDVRPMPQRPYSGIPYEALTDKMKAFVQRWEENPYYVVWKFEGDTGPENNWAGWGPPPKGWTNRIDIPHIVNDDGTWTYFGDALPWPPAGDPGDIGAWSDPLLLGSISAEEYATLTPDQIRQLNQQRMDEIWAEVVKTASIGDELKIPTPKPTPVRGCAAPKVNLPDGDKKVQTQCNGERSWNQICSELKTACWPNECVVGDVMLDQYNRTSCGSRYVPPTPTPTPITGAKLPTATSASRTGTTASSIPAGTSISLGPLLPNTDYCVKASPNDPICKIESAQVSSCSFYQSCVGVNNTGGSKLCNSKVVNGACSKDPAVYTCSSQCNVAIVTQSSQTGSASPAIPATTTQAQTSQVTTVRYRISDNPADLAGESWVAYAAEKPFQPAKTPWFAYTEPLIINLEFKDKNPGTKFFFVEFEDSNGKRGGCGVDGTRPCTASIVYDPTTSQEVNCKIENRSLADIFPSGKPDGFVNVNDASYLIKQMSSASSGSSADINKDGVTNTCDFSLIQTNFGKI